MIKYTLKQIPFDNVQLNVPGSTVKAVQTYEATVTWALSLTPEA
ncbi:WxL domain-containing protein [Carnobacterium divergens]|nr:WxL domain-containing protein [Carnobacterium divergens]